MCRKQGQTNEAIYIRSGSRAVDVSYRAGGTDHQALFERLDVSYNASNRDGNPMCVMAAKYDWADGANGAVYVKWTEQVGARWQLRKSNWRMPQGSTVPMSITFIDVNRDAPPPQTITADAKTINERSLTSFDINNDDLVSFLKAFGDAEKMTISFPQSNEPQWTVAMDGSRNAVASFEQCIAKIRNTPPPAPIPDDAIADIIIQRSRNQYYATGKPCACTYDKARNGTSCGGRSAHSRIGGADPLCYRSDVKPWMIAQYRQQRQASQ
jgi:hypothetical protein